MKSLVKMVSVVAVLGAGCDSEPTAVVKDMAAASDASVAPDLVYTKVDRGRYIVNDVGACVFCHTPAKPDGSRDLDKALSGIDDFALVPDSVPDGGSVPDSGPTYSSLSSANLTNDDTGLKGWTDDQIKNVWKMGLDKDNKPISAVMPWWIFHNMTEDDMDSVVAYLRTVKGVVHKQKETSGIFKMLPPAKAIDLATIPTPDSKYPNLASATRGRYLAAQAGLCIDCHTPENQNFGDPNWRPIDMMKVFSGGRMFYKEQLGLFQPAYPAKIYTANLTPDATGIKGWSVADVVKAFKGGLDRQGKGVCAATHGATTSAYAGLTDSDANDLANYVLSIPPIANMRPADCMGP